MRRHYLNDEERFGDTGDLPDPPDNLDFLDLFTPDEQDTIDERFQNGIALGQAREIAAATALRMTQRARRARQAPEPVIHFRP